MRVRINEKCRVFHGHVPHDLEEGQEVTGSLAEMLLTRAPMKVTRVDAEAPEEPPAHREPCVDGDICGDDQCPPELDIDASVAKVLEWVGEDRARADEALAAEKYKEKPRATLVKALEQLLAADEG
jgi:hypothetical protein